MDQDGIMDKDELIAELSFYLRATLDWIDAVPKDVASRLPAMPGFNRDSAEETLVAVPVELPSP